LLKPIKQGKVTEGQLKVILSDFYETLSGVDVQGIIASNREFV